MSWPTTTLRHARVEVFDGPHATPPKVGSGPLFLGISNLDNGRLDLTGVECIHPDHFERWTRRVEPRAGDVVFSYETRLGQAALVPPGLKCCLGRRMGLLRVDPAVLDSRFLLYQYLSPEYQDYLGTKTLVGSTVDRLPIADFPDFRIAVPQLEVQRAIAEVLGALDDKVELNRQMNGTIEEMATTLFRSWFVDFEPVTAKADGRQPFGMDAATAALFPSAFDGSSPKGWRLREGASWFTVDKGVSYKGEFLSEAGKPMINLGCFLGRGRFRPERIKGYRGEHKPRHVVRPGDIVMANTDMTQERLILGSPCVVPETGTHPEFLFSHHVFALRLLPGAENAREFIVQALQLDSFRERAEGFANGTTVLGMPSDAVLGAELLDPGLSLIAAFGALATEWRRLAEANTRESRTLNALRDTLLPKLVSGEVRLKQAEKLVEAAL